MEWNHVKYDNLTLTWFTLVRVWWEEINQQIITFLISIIFFFFFFWQIYLPDFQKENLLHLIEDKSYEILDLKILDSEYDDVCESYCDYDFEILHPYAAILMVDKKIRNVTITGENVLIFNSIYYYYFFQVEIYVIPSVAIIHNQRKSSNI